MVAGNGPKPVQICKPLARTKQKFTSLFQWDTHYRKRARDCSLFVVCESLFVELNTPPIHTEQDESEVFGKTKNTRLAVRISKTEYRALLKKHQIRVGA
jgi:hypothetical protein